MGIARTKRIRRHFLSICNFSEDNCVSAMITVCAPRAIVRNIQTRECSFLGSITARNLRELAGMTALRIATRGVLRQEQEESHSH